MVNVHFFPVAAFLRKRRWTKYPMQQFFALKVYEWRAQLEINGPKEFLYHREMRPIKFFAGLHYERKLEERVKQDRKVRNCENCFSRNDLCRSPHWFCAFVSFSGVYFGEVKLGAKPTSLDPRLHLLYLAFQLWQLLAGGGSWQLTLLTALAAENRDQEELGRSFHLSSPILRPR